MEVDKTNRSEVISDLNKLKLKKYSKDIESGIYNFSKDYVIQNEMEELIEQIYMDKASEIINKFKNDGDEIIKLLKEKKIDPKNLASMKPEELNPKNYESIIKKNQIKKYKEENQSANSSFKCSKCGNTKKFNVSQQQIRAGDEPITTFVKCLECGHTFKF